MGEEKGRHHASPGTVPLLLPENWEQILLNLPPADFHAANNTCPEWRQLMMSQRRTVLFPMVLPIIEDYLPLSSILQLRGVTKSINHGINQLLSHCPDIRNSTANIQHLAKLSQVERTCRFWNVDGIEKFMGHMNSRPFPDENPFITGGISISLAGRNEEDTLRRTEAFQLLFSRYGHHLKGVHFNELVIGGRVMETFFSLLHLLPNILSINMIGGVYMEEEEDTVRLTRLTSLEKLTGLHLLAVFEHLHTETEFSIQLLTQYGQQLSSLGVNELLKSPVVSAEFLNSLAPNITHFEMATMDSVALQKLAVASWGLEVLILCSSVRDAMPNSLVNDFLNVVSNFMDTLKDLKFICARNERFYGQWDVGRMVLLPKLKVLTFGYGNLELEWVWEFLKRCCQQVKQVYILNDIPLRDSQLDSLRSMFDEMQRLKRITVVYGYPKQRKVIYKMS